MYEPIYQLRNLTGLITTTYVLAAIVAIVMILISLIVANSVKYQGGAEKRDPKIRRTWFFILAFPAAIAFFIWNYTYVNSLIKGVPAKDQFMIHNAIATGVLLILYFVIGFVIAKLFHQSKYGTIFPSKGN